MTDEKEARESEPVLEDLITAFSEEFTEVAEEGLRNHPGAIKPEVLDQIRDQTSKAVGESAQALSEAIYPNLVRWWDAKVFPLSQSIQQQQAVVQAIVAPDSSAQTITNRVIEQTNILTETLNLTQSVVTVNTSSGVDLSELVLWRWNQTDVSQFDTSTPLQVGEITASMAYRADSDAQIGPTIQFTVTSVSPGGYAAFRIATSENLTLPERFLFRVRYVSSSAVGASPDIMYMGPFFHNGQWDLINIFGFGIVARIEGNFCVIPHANGSGSSPTGPSLLIHRPFKSTSATPSHPEYTSSFWAGTGNTTEYEVYLNSFTADDPPFGSIVARKMGGFGTQTLESTIISSESLLRGHGTPFDATLFPAWTGQQINQFSWMLVTDSPTLSNHKFEIADLCILKHPSDW